MERKSTLGRLFRNYMENANRGKNQHISRSAATAIIGGSSLGVGVGTVFESFTHGAPALAAGIILMVVNEANDYYEGRQQLKKQ